MWEGAGPVRSKLKLDRALHEIQLVKKASQSLSISNIRRYNLEVLDAVELPFMLSTAEAIIVSALGREESRGSHYRMDFPTQDNRHWLRNIVVWENEKGLQMKTEKSMVKATGA